MGTQEEAFIDKFVEMLNTNDHTLQFDGLVGIKKILSIDQPPIQKVIDTGIVPKLLEFLKWSDDIRFQYESSWALTNLCSGTIENTEYVINLGCLDLFIGLFESHHESVADQAVWLIGNISGDTSQLRDLCIEKGCVNKIITVYNKSETNLGVRETIAWALSNLVRTKPIPQWDQISECIAPLIQTVAETQSNEILVDSLWALSYLVDLNTQRAIELHLVPKLFQNLFNENAKILAPILKMLNQIIKDDKKQIKIIFRDPHILQRIFGVTIHTHKVIRRDSSQLIAGLGLGSGDCVKLVLECTTFLVVLHSILKRSEFPIISTQISVLILNISDKITVPELSHLIEEDNYIACLLIMIASKDPNIWKLGVSATLNMLQKGEESLMEKIVYKFINAGLVELLEDSDSDLEDQEFACLVEKILAYFPLSKEVLTQDN